MLHALLLAQLFLNLVYRFTALQFAASFTQFPQPSTRPIHLSQADAMSTNKIWGQLQVDLTKAHPIQRITDSGDFRFVIANDFPPPQPVPWGKDQTWSPVLSKSLYYKRPAKS
ncbi:uncharacterized protein BDZ83DRAFT_79140 [Colletotrichum acutatum]|uniref:Uncharacterized protein n=1 Tax=Glomerella acutata TaxID=27357 RepID=A0AAD8UB77_GLOAC|nr:uncharacterized protein BDZ83DRAFT_79140 [Colletotrichum acutatum]KAK1713754.1 hypothetical protein BDZ83DRAFT_79140 [Colletotrichum acutatum]